MGNWTYIVKELVTGTAIDHVPLNSVEITFTLNEAATMQANLPLRHPKATRATFDPGRVAIWALEDDVPKFGGILWRADIETEKDQLTIEATDHFSWFFTRVLSQTVDYVGKTLEVALLGTGIGANRGLLYRALNETPYKPHGIVLGSERNGVDFLTAAKWDGFELENTGRLVETLSQGEESFDFMMEPAGTLATGFTNTFSFWSPTKFRRTNLRWRIEEPVNPGSNITAIKGSVDASEIANKVWVLGEGEGVSMLVSQVQDSTALSAQYPLYETTLSHKDVKSLSELNKIGNQEVKNLSRPVSSYTAELLPDHPSTQLGSWDLGDTVFLTAKYGYLDIDNQEVRVTSYTVGIADETNDDRVTATMSEFIS